MVRKLVKLSNASTATVPLYDDWTGEDCHWKISCHRMTCAAHSMIWPVDSPSEASGQRDLHNFVGCLIRVTASEIKAFSDMKFQLQHHGSRRRKPSFSEGTGLDHQHAQLAETGYTTSLNLDLRLGEDRPTN